MAPEEAYERLRFLVGPVAEHASHLKAEVRHVWIEVNLRIEFYADEHGPLGNDGSRWHVEGPWVAITSQGRDTWFRTPLATPDEIRAVRRRPVLRRNIGDDREFAISEHHTREAMFVLVGAPVDVRRFNL